MSIDSATVKKVARLARIRVEEDEVAAWAAELSKILALVEQLDEVPTDDVAPMTSVVALDAPLRADKVTDGGMQQKILVNAPEAAAGFFVVPKVVE